jgi:hypothetical protein
MVALRQNLVAPAHAHELAANLFGAINLSGCRHTERKRGSACHAKKKSG